MSSKTASGAQGQRQVIVALDATSYLTSRPMMRWLVRHLATCSRAPGGSGRPGSAPAYDGGGEVRDSPGATAGPPGTAGHRKTARRSNLRPPSTVMKC